MSMQLFAHAIMTLDCFVDQPSCAGSPAEDITHTTPVGTGEKESLQEVPHRESSLNSCTEMPQSGVRPLARGTFEPTTCKGAPKRSARKVSAERPWRHAVWSQARTPHQEQCRGKLGAPKGRRPRCCTTRVLKPSQGHRGGPELPPQKAIHTGAEEDCTTGDGQRPSTLSLQLS